MNLDKLRNLLKNFNKERNYIVCTFAILMCISIIYITEKTTHKKYISNLSQILCKNDINSFNKAIKSDDSITSSDFNYIYNFYLQKNYNKLTNKLIDEDTYIDNLKKIRDLKGVSKKNIVSYLMKSGKYLESQSDYNEALKLMDKKDYKSAFNLLSSITNLSDDYNEAKKKSLDCSNIIKNETAENINNLCDNKKFDDAEKILNENNKYLQPNDYNNLSNTITKSKELYINSLPVYNSNHVYINNVRDVSGITYENINTSDLQSETKYLIYVNTAKQITYIFCGTKNSWVKYKEFTCSTGINDSATPTGFFKVGTKGEWFFSQKYGQGGKYWTAFKGSNYLFHSVPYDSSATKILDNTLGTAASHGCIRLATDDSKFIHDIVPTGTSIIIN